MPEGREAHESIYKVLSQEILMALNVVRARANSLAATYINRAACKRAAPWTRPAERRERNTREGSGGESTRVRRTVVETSEEAAGRVRIEKCQTPARRAVARDAFASGGRWRWRGSKMEPESKESGSLKWILFRQRRAHGALVHANRGSASTRRGRA